MWKREITKGISCTDIISTKENWNMKTGKKKERMIINIGIYEVIVRIYQEKKALGCN